MSATTADKRSRFRAMHESGCFVLPNPWDRGSAKLFERMGFEALATSSSAAAWTMGRSDYDLQIEDVLGHLSEMAAATDLPINADFESGFAEDTEQLASNVVAAADTGVAALSIEDRRKDEGGFYDLRRATDRIVAARRSLDAAGRDVILVARADALLEEPTIVKQVIDRLVAFADAGADCLYAPGLRDRSDVADAVRAVAPKPLNVLVQSPWTTLSEMRDIGVRRISVGASLAMAGWSAVIDAARRLGKGSFESLVGGEARAFLETAFADTASEGARAKPVRSSM